MLKRLSVKNFTVFAEADFEFGPGLNVVVGTNGTGKSHVLKLGYATGYSAINIIGDEWLVQDTHNWQNQVSRDFQELFRPERIGRLVRWGADNAEVTAQYSNPALASVKLHFAAAAQMPVVVGNQPIEVEEFLPTEYELFAPVFIPAKEVLTLSWMLPAANQLKLPIDSSYLHLLNQLRGIARQQPEAPDAIAAIAAILGGDIREEGDKYYLIQADGQRVEADMVAEGLRKFGVLQRLLSNGSLTIRNTLFWDEPEANLNPALLRKLAAVLAELARQGFQIILATHSLFLLNELHVLAQTQQAPVRYFGLYPAETGETKVEQTDDLETLNHLVALDEELAQTARFQRVLDSEDPHADHS